ncbi:hypothetical protein ORI99_00150 [Alishewanella sp. SMS9]|nr:hypothetical protein [Alishewanella sp. SMS9]
MKHTKEQLQGMSDFEVNYALADLIGFKEIKKSGDSGLILDWHSTPPGFKINKADYCNNPSDIMPLAFEHGIHFGPQHKAWYAIHDASMLSENPIEAESESPLRAIACCLILVLQDK